MEDLVEDEVTVVQRVVRQLLVFCFSERSVNSGADRGLLTQLCSTLTFLQCVNIFKSSSFKTLMINIDLELK